MHRGRNMKGSKMSDVRSPGPEARSARTDAPPAAAGDWRTVVSLAWVAVVFVFFFRQYAEKILDKLGI